MRARFDLFTKLGWKNLVEYRFNFSKRELLSFIIKDSFTER